MLPLFFIVSTIAIVSALAVIFNKNVVYSALSLLVNFAMLSIFYFMLNAQFLGVVQILVYAGAIVVLFLFVVMLLGADLGEEMPELFKNLNPLVIVFALLLLTFTGTTVFEGLTVGQSGDMTQAAVEEYGHTELIGIALLTDHMLSVQLAGILLMVGIVGVIWLTRREKDVYYVFDNPQAQSEETQ